MALRQWRIRREQSTIFGVQDRRAAGAYEADIHAGLLDLVNRRVFTSQNSQKCVDPAGGSLHGCLTPRSWIKGGAEWKGETEEDGSGEEKGEG